jgi:integrase
MWTDLELKALKPKNKAYLLSEKTKERGAGRLAIEVKPDSSKHFYFLYYLEGKRKLILIDRYKDTPRANGLSVKDARNKKDTYSEIYKENENVKEYLAEQEQQEKERKRLKNTQGSFEQLVESYVANMKAEGKRTWSNVDAELKRYVFIPFPELKEVKASDIKVADIKSILARMINELGITTQANRVRSYLHTAFQHGLKQDNDPRNFLHTDVMFNLEFNPVSAIPRQKDFEYVGERHLTDDEVKLIWNHKVDDFGPIVGRLIKFLLAIGGQRPNEILNTPWSGYDFKQNVLSLSANVTKNKRPHLIPLNRLALEVLEDLKPMTGRCEFPFAGSIGNAFKTDKPMRSDSLNRALSRYCLSENWATGRLVSRDIRRTVKTQMGKAGLSKAIRDRLQNHALTDVSSVHYDRYDYLKEKREAMDAWDSYLELLIRPKKNVVHINQRKKEV